MPDPPVDDATVADPAPPPEKQSEYTPEFDAFWQAYPRRNGTARGSKAEAFRAWKHMVVRERKAATEGARRYAVSQEARRENGRYIPDACRWLKGKRWEVVDEGPDGSEADIPPAWASWEKDAAGDWIPLRGDAETGRLPYGAEDVAEVTRLHRKRWEQEMIRRKGSNGHRPGVSVSATTTHGGMRA